MSSYLHSSALTTHRGENWIAANISEGSDSLRKLRHLRDAQSRSSLESLQYGNTIRDLIFNDLVGFRQFGHPR